MNNAHLIGADPVILQRWQTTARDYLVQELEKRIGTEPVGHCSLALFLVGGERLEFRARWRAFEVVRVVHDEGELAAPEPALELIATMLVRLDRGEIPL